MIEKMANLFCDLTVRAKEIGNSRNENGHTNDEIVNMNCERWKHERRILQRLDDSGLPGVSQNLRWQTMETLFQICLAVICICLGIS